MERRRFLTLLGGVAVWPLVAHAQPSNKTWRIGFLAHRYEEFYDPLFQGLRELGYVEGRNLIVERRYAEGHVERFQEFAAEMVRLKVDLVIVVTTPAAFAVRNLTTTIPIVHPAAIDPVGTGLIASLAHPGGNITGLAVLNAETSAKRLELLREVVPGLSRGAVLWNSANPANSLAWKETEGAGRTLSVALQSIEVRGPNDFERAFARIAEQHPDVLLVLQDALTLEYRKEIIGFALRERLPSMFVGKEWVEEGGLMSYGDKGIGKQQISSTKY
jgi:putative ABC transport system substrate-binding protein